MIRPPGSKRLYKTSREQSINFPNEDVSRVWRTLDKLKVTYAKYPKLIPRANFEAEVTTRGGTKAYVFFYGQYKRGSSGMPAHSKIALERKIAFLETEGHPYLKLKRTDTTEQIEIKIRRWLKSLTAEEAARAEAADHQHPA